MTAPALSFDMPDLGPQLAALSDAELDMLDFGVIGFDGDTVVCRYNKIESTDAGLSPQRVLGQPLFTNVAPCMNNFMVATRFEDAMDAARCSTPPSITCSRCACVPSRSRCA